ncbi:MAG: hypothetical protein ACLVGV_07740 [Methanobrevibacter smithii]
MIDETLLLYVIGENEKEFRKKLLSIQKECNNSLRDMEYGEVITHSVNLHTLMNVICILNQLMEDISSGKFNTENIGSCCGGVCGKQ